MHLQEFIDYRTHCPLCNTALITKFISDRKQRTRFINGRYVFVILMKGLKSREPDYEVGYSFGLKDNSLVIELEKAVEWETSNSVTMHLVSLFKKFHDNIRGPSYRFERVCTFCYKYSLKSTPIDFDLAKASYHPFQISQEHFLLTQPCDEDCKVIMLNNTYESEASTELSWWRADKEEQVRLYWSLPFAYSKIDKLPLIPFVSKEETYQRLSLLITFA